MDADLFSLASPTAILFARAGANVIVSARRADKLKEVAEAAKQANKEGGTGHGGKVHELVMDVSDRKSADGEFIPFLRLLKGGRSD